MNRLSMCRICLVENVTMYSLVNTKLQDLYEKLTTMPFQSEDSKPLQVCYVCHARLQACHRLQINCLTSEKLLKQILENDQIQPTILKNTNTVAIKHPVVHLSYVPRTLKVPGVRGIKAEDNINDAQVIITDDELYVQCTGLRHNIKTEDIFDEHDDSNRSVHTVRSKDNLVAANTELSVEYDMKPAHSVQDTERDNGNDDVITLNDLKPKYNIAIENNVLLEPVNMVLDRTDLNYTKTHPSAAETHQLSLKNGNIHSSVENNPLYTDKMENLKQYIRDKKKVTEIVPEKTYKCYRCDRSFSEKQSFKQHTYMHKSGRPYICDICKKGFSLKHNLVKHIRLHAGEKPFKCDLCGKCFSENSYLTQHNRTHTDDKSYKCYICGLCFTTKSCLTQHIHVHTGEKPYKCEICEKRFNLKQQAEEHVHLHTGEKPYKCDVCERYFNRKSNLTQHIRMHTGVKPYKCDICEKGYNQKRYFVQHICSHTGEKPYKCNLCEKRFSHKHNLNQHIPIHAAEKPYKCDVCLKGFHLKKILMRHFHVHTGEKPYKCDTCDKQFNRKTQLTLHSRVHSGDKAL